MRINPPLPPLSAALRDTRPGRRARRRPSGRRRSPTCPAPMTWPFILIGMPPAKIITRLWFDTWMPKNWSPGWLLRPSSRVEISEAFAVKALLMAMSMLPSHAPSMRTKAVRFAPTSTTAIFIASRYRAWPAKDGPWAPAEVTRRRRHSQRACPSRGRGPQRLGSVAERHLFRGGAGRRRQRRRASAGVGIRPLGRRRQPGFDRGDRWRRRGGDLIRAVSIPRSVARGCQALASSSRARRTAMDNSRATSDLAFLSSVLKCGVVKCSFRASRLTQVS
jgi:hypothetical protein